MKESKPAKGSIGKYLRQLRLERGWTLKQTADAAQMDWSYLSKAELGDIKQPDPRYLANLATVLDVPVADLYSLAGYTAPQELPSFGPYLRARYRLRPEEIAQLESYFSFLRHQYGIANDEPVFPKRGVAPKPPRKRMSPRPRPTGGPWDDPDLSADGGEAA